MEAVHKVTLSSGRVVLIRNPRFRHMRHAETLAGGVQNQLAFQEELLKMLLFKIDDVEIKKPDLVDLDDLLALNEIIQLGQVVAKLSGNETGSPAKVEQIFGGQ